MEDNEVKKCKEERRRYILICAGIAAGTALIAGGICYFLGHKNGCKEGYKKGFKDGYKAGYKDGYETGFREGFSHGFSSAEKELKELAKMLFNALDSSYEKGKTSMGSELSINRDKIRDEGIRKGIEIERTYSKNPKERRETGDKSLDDIEPIVEVS